MSVEAESTDNAGTTEREALRKLDLLAALGYRRFKLVDQDSLNYLAPLARLVAGAVRPLDSLLDAYRTGGGVPYADYGADLREGQTISLVDLVTKTRLVPSKSEARRLIIQGGLEVDEQKQSDAKALLSIVAGRVYRLKIGRRKFALVELPK